MDLSCVFCVWGKSKDVNVVEAKWWNQVKSILYQTTSMLSECTQGNHSRLSIMYILCILAYLKMSTSEDVHIWTCPPQEHMARLWERGTYTNNTTWLKHKECMNKCAYSIKKVWCDTVCVLGILLLQKYNFGTLLECKDNAGCTARWQSFLLKKRRFLLQSCKSAGANNCLTVALSRRAWTSLPVRYHHYGEFSKIII